MNPKLQTRPWLITLAILPAILVSLHGGNPGNFTLPGAVQRPDTVVNNVPDTLKLSADSIVPSEGAAGFKLEANIDYAAADSISFDLQEKMAYMYGDANIVYKDLKLKAGRIDIDFNRKLLHARFIADSTGKKTGIPDFTQGTTNFKSDQISYNFTNRKGMIKNVITREGEGYLHATAIKKLSENENAAKGGMYTTCDLEDPHFAIRFSKAKVITGDKIVTGPAYMNIEGVPLPLALPFGIFPNKKGRNSGIVIPKYGESTNRGFYLEDGGYYFGINDYFDLKLTGDIYSRGSWALKPTMSYRKRYKYNGNFSLKFATNILGVKGSPDYQKSRDFFVTWSHRQDAKARPNSTFSASVNAGSSKYNYFNPSSVNNYLTNTFSSSISYDLRLGKNANLTASARHSQNTRSRLVTLSLPEVSFGLARFYPFKRKIQTGKPRWYESISVTYNANMRNEINTPDSLLFKPEALENFVSGIQHKVPVSGSFKLLKYFTLSTGVSYTERWYGRTIRKTYMGEKIYQDGDSTYVRVDTVNGFRAARDYNFSSSINTTLYGMLKFRKGPVRAIRHVVRPSAGFSYIPDFGSENFGYYRTVQTDTTGQTEKYSIFGDGRYYTAIFGVPPANKSGALNFSISNNLEMKVRSKKDTVTGVTKVMLIDNFSLGASYDLARDSLRWSNLSMNGRTTLFKKIQINYSSSWSPYALNAKGLPYNTYEWAISGKPLRFNNTSWNLSVGYDFSSSKKSKKASPPPQSSPQEVQELQESPESFVDWDNPWNFRIDYNFRYFSQPDKTTGERKKELVQTFRVQGELNITEKWKVSAQTGYDLQSKDFAFTQMTVYRNLHCWEMRFNWIPYGFQKSWNFQINVKSAMLQDLKLTKKKDFRDNL